MMKAFSILSLVIYSSLFLFHKWWWIIFVIFSIIYVIQVSKKNDVFKTREDYELKSNQLDKRMLLSIFIGVLITSGCVVLGFIILNFKPCILAFLLTMSYVFYSSSYKEELDNISIKMIGRNASSLNNNLDDLMMRSVDDTLSRMDNSNQKRFLHTTYDYKVVLNDEGKKFVDAEVKNKNYEINNVYGDTARTLSEELFYRDRTIVYKYEFEKHFAHLVKNGEDYDVYIGSDNVCVGSLINTDVDRYIKDGVEMFAFVSGGLGKMLIEGVERPWFDKEQKYDYELIFRIRD